MVQSTHMFSVSEEWELSVIGSCFLVQKFPKIWYNNVLY